MKPVTASRIPDDKRINVLPKYFGAQHLKFEMLVYTLMTQFCEKYSGGYWDFLELSNDGFYMALRGETEFDVINPLNHFHATMSAEATSIAVNIIVLSWLASEEPKHPNADRLPQLCAALYDYACQHAEWALIGGLID